MTDERADLEGKTDDELVAMLRDRQSGEWRPGALVAAAAILTDRGVPLPAADAVPDEEEPVELVTVATFLTPGEAEPARNALTAAGFRVLAKDLATVYADGLLAPMLGGVRIQVPAEQADDAREFLRQADAGALAPPSPCPSCGSEDSSAATRPGKDGSDEVWFRCGACGHEWQ